MTAVKQYYQCRMRCGNTEMIGWIEARGAKVGALVEILPRKLLWTVTEVYKHGLPEDMLRQHQRNHRKSFASIEAMA